MLGIVSSAFETALMVLEPAYKTYKELKELEAPPQEDSDGGGGGSAESIERRRRLFVHWIVYAGFRAVDCAVRPWLPMYNVINIAAVVWLRTGGSETVYRTVIRPFLAEHEDAIDRWTERIDGARNAVTADAVALLGTTADGGDVN